MARTTTVVALDRCSAVYGPMAGKTASETESFFQEEGLPLLKGFGLKGATVTQGMGVLVEWAMFTEIFRLDFCLVDRNFPYRSLWLSR